MAARRQAQETDSVLSPELSPFCLKAGSIRRSSSRRRRSHRMLSEETAEEAAEEKFDPLDEPVVHQPTIYMLLSVFDVLITSHRS